MHECGLRKPGCSWDHSAHLPLPSSFCGRAGMARIAYNNFSFLHTSRRRAFRLVRWVARYLWSAVLCAVHAVSAVTLTRLRGNVMCEDVRMKGNDSVYFRQQSERQTDNGKSPQGIVSCWLSFPSLKCLGSEILPIQDIFGFWNICVDSPIWKFSLSNSSKTGFRAF